MRAMAWGLWLLLSLTAGEAVAQDMQKLHAEAFAQMQKWIRSRDVEQRRQAAQSLGGFADYAASAESLARALSDSDGEVRLRAAASLWKLADAGLALDSARPALGEALFDRSIAVRAQAAGALQASGTPSSELVAARRSVLREGDWFHVALVARDLIGDVPALELVDPLLWSSREAPPVRDPRDRFDAGDVWLPLVRHGDRSIIEPLRAALADPELPKPELIVALAAFEPMPERWRETLLQTVRDADPATREQSLRQLRALLERSPGERAWVHALVPLLEDPYADVGYAACELFAAAGGDGHRGVPALIERLAEAGDPRLQRAAIRALAAIADPAEAYDRSIKSAVSAQVRPRLEALAAAASEQDTREAAQAALKVLDQGSATGTQVLQAADGGDDAARQRLRERGIDFTEDAFWRALGERDVDTVRDLFAAGFSAAALASAEVPPLHLLVMSGCDYGQPTAEATRQLVDLLLRHGADPKQRDRAGGNTALHRASSCDAKLVRQLLKGGVDPRARNDGKLSAFSMFLATNTDAAQALVDAGFRLDASEAKTMLGWYRAEKDPAKRRLMQRAGVQAFDVERP